MIVFQIACAKKRVYATDQIKAADIALHMWDYEPSGIPFVTRFEFDDESDLVAHLNLLTNGGDYDIPSPADQL